MTDSQTSPADHLPNFTRPVRHRSLRTGAEVHRDPWGIPHIRSDNLYDLFFAQGFATAQDRLWQMDFDRMRGLGRSGEIFGAEAEHNDSSMRDRRFDRVAKDEYAIGSDDAKTALDGYADGVNAFIEGPDSLSFEHGLLNRMPEMWEPWHCIVVYKVRNSAEGNLDSKLQNIRLLQRIGEKRAAELFRGYLPGMYLTVPPGVKFHGQARGALDELRLVAEATLPALECDFGSNGWAVSGDLTESGLPMVGGDSHRRLESPNVYYQTHLTHLDFDVIGFSIPGMPLVMHFAHNRYVAWGMTHGGCDTQDMFLEKLRKVGDKVQYLFRDEWLDVEKRTEVFRFADIDSSSHSTEDSMEVYETRHGPLLSANTDTGFGIALADPGSAEATPWVDAALAAMRSRNADEFEAALNGWTDRVNNYPYADIYGEFGYCLKGRVPMRTFANGFGPVPGWTGDHEWQGYIPPHQMPRVRNPETGWAVTCNQRVVGDDYPFWLATSFGPDYRARRIVSHIEGHIAGGTRITVSDMRAFHADTVSIPALQFKTWLDAAWTGLVCDQLADDSVAFKAAKDLRDWNGDMDSRLESGELSRAPLLFKLIATKISVDVLINFYGADERSIEAGVETIFYDHYRRNLKPEIFAEFARGKTGLEWRGVDLDRVGIVTLKIAAQLLNRNETEGCCINWNELHTSAHLYSPGFTFPKIVDGLGAMGIAIPGDEDVPFAASDAVIAGITSDFSAKSGPVNRYLHDPSDWSNSKWIVPLGVSGNSASPHFADQQQMWADVEYIPQLYEWDDIREQAESVQVFAPEA